MLFLKNAFLCQLLHQLIANFPTVSRSVIKAYENNLLISFHFETNRQLNQRSKCENSIGLLCFCGRDTCLNNDHIIGNEFLGESIGCGSNFIFSLSWHFYFLQAHILTAFPRSPKCRTKWIAAFLKNVFSSGVIQSTSQFLLKLSQWRILVVKNRENSGDIKCLILLHTLPPFEERLGIGWEKELGMFAQISRLHLSGHQPMYPLKFCTL